MKQKNNKTILLGMSGGVDSSVAALLLKKQGNNVIGVFMKNFSDNKNPITKECSFKEDKKSAQKIASMLDIPLHIIDFEKEYDKNVIKPMVKNYSKNLIPNPDILCNKTIKFPLLWKCAKKFKADAIATGHYARIKKQKSGFALLAGKDRTKDQSYFLAELNQNDLSHTIFPLGNLKKSQVRKIAKNNNFPNWNKIGSRGICFIGKINMKAFLEQKIKGKKGPIVDEKENIMGHHPGTQYYTIGQRIGPRLGLELNNKVNSRFYIAEKKNNTLLVVKENSPLLKKQIVKIKSLHIINPKERIPLKLKARIRHLGEFHEGKLIRKSSIYYFKFKKPIKAIAEGQYIVLYHKDKVVASGEIRL